MQLTESPRANAAYILARWFRDMNFPDRLVKRVEKGNPFVMEVVYGVLRRQALLSWIETRFSRGEISPEMQALVLSALYQLFFMDNEPEHAVVHDTVELAKTTGEARAPGYVNAILRRALAEKQQLLSDAKNLPLWLQHSHPEHLFYRWTKQFGHHATLKLMEWNNQPAPVMLTVNTLACKATELLAKLKAAGIAAEAHPFNRARSILLKSKVKLREVPGYEEGLFFVQDPAATLAPEMLAPQPGQTVLDACAAPGGKTLLLAGLMQNKGQLLALERHLDRMPPLEDNIRRCHATCVSIHQADATETDELRRLFETRRTPKFDAILADVPCSNTGVFRRRPDARWRFTYERLMKLVKTQDAILESLSGFLRPGGRMVYSTCSLEPEENADRITAFLSRHPEFKKAKEQNVLPHAHQTDGAYTALLVKSN